MAIRPRSTIRQVKGITAEQEQLMRAYLQGAVYSWAKNRSGDQFAARDLFGGVNAKWEETPLCPLYEKHRALGKSVKKAINAAGVDCGWLLKSVLAEDRRHFIVGRSGRTAGYCWIGRKS